MTAKNFLFLISASAADRASLQVIAGNITKSVDATAKPLWFDPTHVGYFVTCDMTAYQIWSKAFHSLEPRYAENLRDAMVLEIGSDYMAGSSSKIAAWLNSHGAQRKFGSS